MPEPLLGTPPYRVIARQPDLRPAGQISTMSRLELVPRYNAVGAWSITMPASTAKRALFSTGGGIAVFRPDAGPGDLPLLSGPATSITQVWDESNAGPGTLTVSGVTDEVVLADALAWPQPDKIITAQTDNTHDVRTGVLETVLRGYVDRNIGLSAQVVRRSPRLQLAPDQARGPSVNARVRFLNLLEYLASLAVLGPLGFRVAQLGTNLQFSIYQPVTTPSARFSVGLGNLRAYSYETVAPTVTRAIIGAGGDGTARIFREYPVGASTPEQTWGRRIETFTDQRQTTDLTEVAQAGTEALANGGPQTALSMTPIDIPLLRFGREYNLGDKVTVEIEGTPIVDVVREVRITWDADDGERVKPLVGTEGALPPGADGLFARLTRRFGRLGSQNQYQATAK